jgi:hypothetical protein
VAYEIGKDVSSLGYVAAFESGQLDDGRAPALDADGRGPSPVYRPRARGGGHDGAPVLPCHACDPDRARRVDEALRSNRWRIVDDGAPALHGAQATLTAYLPHTAASSHTEPGRVYAACGSQGRRCPRVAVVHDRSLSAHDSDADGASACSTWRTLEPASAAVEQGR